MSAPIRTSVHPIRSIRTWPAWRGRTLPATMPIRGLSVYCALLLALLVVLIDAGHARAAANEATTATTATTAATPAWAAIGFDQNLNARLPLDAAFVDDDGRSIELGDALGGKPAVLVFNYYDCPNLCPVTLDALFDALPRLGLQPGRDFTIVAVSIDPREGPELAARKKAGHLRRHPGAELAAGVHFLTGQPGPIERLAATAGLRYAYDARLDQYAHATGLVVVTADGRIARYLFGANFPPQALRLSLVEASDNRIGTLTDRLWLSCFHYDPATGRYSLAILGILRVLGVACALVLGAGVAVLLARERRTRLRGGRP